MRGKEAMGFGMGEASVALAGEALEGGLGEAEIAGHLDLAGVNSLYPHSGFGSMCAAIEGIGVGIGFFGVENSRMWGGFFDFQHYAPGAAERTGVFRLAGESTP